MEDSNDAGATPAALQLTDLSSNPSPVSHLRQPHQDSRSRLSHHACTDNDKNDGPRTFSHLKRRSLCSSPRQTPDRSSNSISSSYFNHHYHQAGTYQRLNSSTTTTTLPYTQFIPTARFPRSYHYPNLVPQFSWNSINSLLSPGSNRGLYPTTSKMSNPSTPSSPRSPTMPQGNPWQTKLVDYCNQSGLGQPVWSLRSDQRGCRTAWSCVVTVGSTSFDSRYCYDGKYINNAKEDASEVALEHLGNLQQAQRSYSVSYKSPTRIPSSYV